MSILVTLTITPEYTIEDARKHLASPELTLVVSIFFGKSFVKFHCSFPSTRDKRVDEGLIREIPREISPS
jgi:hypothetical protein